MKLSLLFLIIVTPTLMNMKRNNHSTPPPPKRINLDNNYPVKADPYRFIQYSTPESIYYYLPTLQRNYYFFRKKNNDLTRVVTNQDEIDAIKNTLKRLLPSYFKQHPTIKNNWLFQARFRFMNNQYRYEEFKDLIGEEIKDTPL